MESKRKTSIDVSIVIVNYNSLGYIKNCIESILFSLTSHNKKNSAGKERSKARAVSLGNPKDSIIENESSIGVEKGDKKKYFRDSFNWEIIVVDNGSIDGSIDYLRKLEGKIENIHFIEAGRNLGFSKASNIGADKSKGKFLLFLNPDTKFTDGNLENVIEFYSNKSKTGKVGIVGAKLINTDGSIQYSCRSFPTLARQFFESYFLHRLFKNFRVFGSYFLSWWDHNAVREVDWLSGAFMLIEKDNFNEVDGFDEDYFMFSEDSDLCLRLYKKGFKNYYFPFFKVKHFDSAISSRDKAAREVQIWKSRVLYFKKNYSMLHARVLSFLYLLGVINRIILFIILSIFKPLKENRAKVAMYVKTLKLYKSTASIAR